MVFPLLSGLYFIGLSIRKIFRSRGMERGHLIVPEMPNLALDEGVDKVLGKHGGSENYNCGSGWRWQCKERVITIEPHTGTPVESTGISCQVLRRKVSGHERQDCKPSQRRPAPSAGVSVEERL